jgi:hypothetical protein
MSGHQISHKLVLQEYTLEAINAIGVAFIEGVNEFESAKCKIPSF